MSDDAQQFYNAWSNVFTKVSPKKLLCYWHVDRAWRKALQQMVDSTEVRVHIYHHLCVMHESTDEAQF